jgi:hypothetical protein
LLNELVQALYLQESKVYTVAGLLPRFKVAADNNRTDSTINQVTYVLESVHNKDPDFVVTAQDLKDLSNKFYTSSTNFHSEFADLLEEQEINQVVQAPRIEAVGTAKDLALDGAYEAPKELVDISLSYTPEELKVAHYASLMIADEFNATGLVAKTSSTLKHKTADMFLFQTRLKLATTETSVFVPVEIKNDVPLFPQVMSTTEKVYTLDSSGLQDLALDLERAEKIKQAQHVGSLRTAEEFEMALRDDMMKYDEEVTEYDLEEPKQVSLGHDEIEQVLKDAVLARSSIYTKSAHLDGSKVVAASLSQLGFKGTQVKFAGDTEEGMNFEANIITEAGKVNVSIPVEIKKDTIMPPYYFGIDGQFYDLSREAIVHIARITKTAHVEQEEINPLLFPMSYPDLRKHLKAAAHHKNHKLAQQIINLVDEKFGDHYRNAVTDDYQTWLGEATASYQSRCGGCDYYVPKTSQAQSDYCNLIKTASKNITQDIETGICTRSTYAGSEDPTFLDVGGSIKITWED